MLKLRKKLLKNLSNNTYKTFYYLYNQNKFLLNCASYQSSFFCINYLLLLKNYLYSFKFKKLNLSFNLQLLKLKKLILLNLYRIMYFLKSISCFIKFKKLILLNFNKLLLLTSQNNLTFMHKKYVFNKRWAF
jgi:hypothetical protein